MHLTESGSGPGCWTYYWPFCELYGTWKKHRSASTSIKSILCHSYTISLVFPVWEHVERKLNRNWNGKVRIRTFPVVELALSHSWLAHVSNFKIKTLLFQLIYGRSHCVNTLVTQLNVIDFIHQTAKAATCCLQCVLHCTHSEIRGSTETHWSAALELLNGVSHNNLN